MFALFQPDTCIETQGFFFYESAVRKYYGFLFITCVVKDIALDKVSCHNQCHNADPLFFSNISFPHIGKKNKIVPRHSSLLLPQTLELYNAVILKKTLDTQWWFHSSFLLLVFSIPLSIPFRA